MPVVAKMTTAHVNAPGGGWHGPLCQAFRHAPSWPPPEDCLSSATYYGHGPGDCARCDELAAELPELDDSHHSRQGQPRSVSIPGKGREEVRLQAVASGGEDDPNREWAAATPDGHVELTIANPGAWGFFKPGVDYIVEFREHVPARGRRESSSG